MAPRRRRRRGRGLGRRRLRCWCGSLLLWCGSLRLWCRSFLLPWGGQRLFCSRWRCRNRRHERLCRRRRDLWRRIRRELPQGDWPDECGEHRAMLARYRPALMHRLVRCGMSPLRSEPGRHRQLCSTDHARGGAHQGSDHRTLSMYSPPAHRRLLRRRYPVMVRRRHTPTQPSRDAPNLRVCAKAKW
jgi:hypothetical protein